jgi:hypothetical protein
MLLNSKEMILPCEDSEPENNQCFKKNEITAVEKEELDRVWGTRQAGTQNGRKGWNIIHPAAPKSISARPKAKKHDNGLEDGTCKTLFFPGKTDWAAHYRYSHTDNPKFACGVPGCSAKFQTSTQTLEHIKKHHIRKCFI